LIPGPVNSTNALAASLSLELSGRAGSLDSLTAFLNFSPTVPVVIGFFASLHLLRNPGRSLPSREQHSTIPLVDSKNVNSSPMAVTDSESSEVRYSSGTRLVDVNHMSAARYVLGSTSTEASKQLRIIFRSRQGRFSVCRHHEFFKSFQSPGEFCFSVISFFSIVVMKVSFVPERGQPAANRIRYHARRFS
jgi:hypothetical protein